MLSTLPKITKSIWTGFMLLLFICLSLTANAQDVSPECVSTYQRFLENYKSNQQVAYEIGKDYLRKCPTDNEVGTFLKRYVFEYERRQATPKSTPIPSANWPARSGLRWFPKETDVAIPPVDAPKIDPSKVIFWLDRKGCSDPASLAGSPYVFGFTCGIDLSDDLTARQILQMGITFGREKCPSTTHLFVFLRPLPYEGHPEWFKNLKDEISRGKTDWVDSEFGFTNATGFEYPSDVVEGGYNSKYPDLIRGYRNWPQALKKQRAEEAEQERQRNAQLEQIRQAQQRAEARWDAFLKKYNVKKEVTIYQLMTNPFAYEGQVVATIGAFQRMNTRTQAVFSWLSHEFVVSGVSANRFTGEERVALAVRVLGNIELRPGYSVPHLSLVAIYVP